MQRKFWACVLSFMLLSGILGGCSRGGANRDALLDNPRNQDDIGERELLVVSFGTSYNDARRVSIGGVEDALAAAYPDWSVRRAFTSQIVLDHVRERDGVAMDNVRDALNRAVANGVRSLVVQPTHLMNGFEYQELADELASRVGEFEYVAIGAPLLSTDDDFRRVAEAVTASAAEYGGGETAFCFMGHGTEAASNGVYEKMQSVLPQNCYVGTVEAEPSLEDVLSAVRAGGYKRVVLQPLMLVAGDHANHDMAGDEPESWKSVFESAGYETVCVLRGLGELDAVQALFVEHARAAMDGGGLSATAGAEYASALPDGTYRAQVESDSPMFRVTDCALTVSGGTTTAVMTMGGTGYLYVYPGTAAEAANAPESDYVPFVETPDGLHTFTIPVAALNTGVPCAAYSGNRAEWYDRTLTFRVAALPDGVQADETAAPPDSDALPENAPRTIPESDAAALPDGFEYRAGPRYAEHFTIACDEAGRALVTIDGTEQFLVVPEGAEAPENPGDIPVLQAPLRGVYVAASSAMDFFRCLDALDAVRFTSTAPENWSIPAIRGAIDAGEILYAGKYSAPDFELLLSERCTLAVESTMIYHSPDIRERLEALGVPVLVERSSYEADPLGRMEWVKLYGLLTGRAAEADAFFDAQAEAVESIRAEDTLGKTVAFFAVSPNGYVSVRKPGDYVAKMIEYAGGEYAFPETESDNLQMEAFYAAARDADVLLYDGTIDGGLETLEQLYGKSALFRDFAAARNGNVWCVERDLFQEPTAAGGVIADFHAVFSGAADAETRLTYLHRVS